MLCECPEPPRPAQLAFRNFEAGIEERFQNFHIANPDVFAGLVEMGLEWKRKGHAHCSINMLWNILRYRRGLVTTDGAHWKLNNSYTSRYARLIMRQVPELNGFFTTRELHS